MERFFVALQFLTIIPVKVSGAHSEKDLAKSSAYFPLVGAVQGIVLVGAYLLFSRFFPSEITSALILITLILTNGGFHLDGFADTVDGLAGGTTKEERLRIMKDSQIGAIGVVAIVLLLLLKFLTIKTLTTGHSSLYTNSILFLLPVIGRWSMVPMMYWADYARDTGGLGKAFTEHTRLKELLLSTSFMLLFSAILLKWNALIYSGIIFIAAYLLTAFFKRKLGGVTGDVLDFQSEVAEVLFLLMAVTNPALQIPL